VAPSLGCALGGASSVKHYQPANRRHDTTSYLNTRTHNVHPPIHDIVAFAARLNKKLIIALPGKLALAVPSLPTVTAAALMS
jgi:hypothetical protein